jgi:hypothetical protein
MINSKSNKGNKFNSEVKNDVICIRFWIDYIEESRRYSSVSALSKTLNRINDHELTIKFPRHPAALILCRGKKWKVSNEFTRFEVMESYIENSKGSLKLRGKNNYAIEIGEGIIGETACYYFMNNDKINKSDKSNKNVATLELLNSESVINNNNQIIVRENGIIEASPNLNGKTINVYHKVTYKNATEQINEDLNKINCNLINLENNLMVYKQLINCSFNSISDTSIRIFNWNDEIEKEINYRDYLIK